MENKTSLASAFRQAEVLLPTLRQQAPQVVPRLAACLYWAVTNTGPEDVTRYRRVFGAPADDPHLNRLCALSQDKAGTRGDAHHHWALYEKDVAAHPDGWPAGQADRARALVLLHMGRNAAAAAEEGDAPRGPFPFWDEPEPMRLKPSAEQCYQRAVELAPDLLEAHEALFRHHLEAGHGAKAERAGRKLLERFADHAATLRDLGELCRRRGDVAEAMRLLQQALHANPLDRELRFGVALAHMDLAREHARAGRLDEARQQLEAADTLRGGADKVLLCLRATVELKARDTARADELLREAASGETPPASLAYAMLVEAALVKMPPALKSRFDREFKAALAGPPDARAAVGLLSRTVSLEAAGVTYYGQKTHAKNIRAYAERAAGLDLGEDDAVNLAGALLAARVTRPLMRLVRSAGKKFPANPFFPFLEATSIMAQDRDEPRWWRIEPLLREAERRAKALPPDERLRALLEEIARCKQELDDLNPLGSAFHQFFDRAGPGPGGDDDNDDFDDYDD
jgi:tetratricopeptide (TPR) repeat protein